MLVPGWMIAASLFLMVLVLVWAMLVALRRNPFPIPDPGSRIFSAASIEAKDALCAAPIPRAEESLSPSG